MLDDGRKRWEEQVSHSFPYGDTARFATEDVADRIGQVGVPGMNLYRALAHAPGLLGAWIDFAWALREECETTRPLRELMILRTAQRALSQYEWHQHRLMVAGAGVDEHQVAELSMWRTFPAFIDAERAALALTDALFDGCVPNQVNAALSEPFDEKARVELTLTAAFYCAMPRLLDALRVPVEEIAPERVDREDGNDREWAPSLVSSLFLPPVPSVERCQDHKYRGYRG